MGLVGTGSSGIQSIPLIAQPAAALTVFQRTPNTSISAHNGPPSPATLEALAEDRGEYREAAGWSGAGVPVELATEGVFTVPEDERRQRFENVWEKGELLAPLSVQRRVGQSACQRGIL